MSAFTRSHFSKPTYNKLCVTNVLFENKQHIDITMSWCKILLTDKVVFKPHFHSPVVRITEQSSVHVETSDKRRYSIREVERTVDGQTFSLQMFRFEAVLITQQEFNFHRRLFVLL